MKWHEKKRNREKEVEKRWKEKERKRKKKWCEIIMIRIVYGNIISHNKFYHGVRADKEAQSSPSFSTSITTSITTLFSIFFSTSFSFPYLPAVHSTLCNAHYSILLCSVLFLFLSMFITIWSTTHHLLPYARTSARSFGSNWQQQITTHHTNSEFTLFNRSTSHSPSHHFFIFALTPKLPSTSIMLNKYTLRRNLQNYK